MLWRCLPRVAAVRLVSLPPIIAFVDVHEAKKGKSLIVRDHTRGLE